MYSRQSSGNKQWGAVLLHILAACLAACHQAARLTNSNQIDQALHTTGRPLITPHLSGFGTSPTSTAPCLRQPRRT